MELAADKACSMVICFPQGTGPENGRHQGNRLDDAETWILYWQSHAQG